jgi:hypothetical protein
LSGIDVTDAAARSAAQRAEMERQLTVNILRKAAAEAEAREQSAKDAAKTAGRAAFGSGLVTAMGLAGSPDAIAAGQAKQAAEYRRLGGQMAEKLAKQEGELKTALLAQADALSKATGLTLKATEVAGGHASAVRGQSQAIDDGARATADYIQSLERELEVIGQSSDAIRRLSADREIEAALARGDVDSAVRIHQLIREIEATENLAKALEYMAKARKSALEGANEPLRTIPRDVQFDKPDEIGELIRQLDEAARAADDVRYAVDDIFWGIKDKNWAAAFAGLFRVIQQLEVAFDKTASKSQRMGAAGSVLTSVGGQVGGTAGSVLSSVGSGFSAASAAAGMAGTMGGLGSAIAGMAGPIGIAVAGFSLLNSVLSNQAAKKRAKQEKEAQDIANARQAAQEQANKRAELELRILELSGDEVGALARKREAELVALDASNRALQQHIYALEDWASAVSKAKDAVTTAEQDLRAAYDAQKSRLEAIIGGVDSARDRLREAYQRERGAIDSTISSLRSAIETFAAFRAELDMVAANDAGRQYGAAQRAFASATNDNLIERGRTFVEASQAASATDLDFQRDLAAVRRRTDDAAKTAEKELSTAERQLLALDAMVAPLIGANDNLLSVDAAIRALSTAEQDAALATEELARLDAQVGALISINSSVMSVAQAISNLQSAIAALAAAEASKPADIVGKGYEAVGFSGYVDKNPDLAALYASGKGMAAGRSKEAFGAYHWERYGQAEGRYFRPFDRGGVFSNSIVHEPSTFHNSQIGERRPEAIMPLVMGPNGLGVQSHGGDSGLRNIMEAVLQELQALRKEQAEDNRELKRDAKDTADVLTKVSLGGDSLRITDVTAEAA